MEPFDTKGEKTGVINYLYKLVWNEQDQMLFEITNGKTVISLLYLEDINRPGELMRDFPYLYPTYYASDVGRILRTFKIKKNVEVTDNGKIII